MNTVKNKKYTLAVSKENMDFIENYPLNEVDDLVDIIWEGYCSEDEAINKFNTYIKEQNKIYRELNNSKKWRCVHLYDYKGIKIKQEG